MNKVYSAVDKIDGEESIFLVKANGDVNVSHCFPDWGVEDEIYAIKKALHRLPMYRTARFKDAIDPVLIGEFS